MRITRHREGDHWPTRDEVSANLVAGATWAGERDLPDVDAWGDFIAAPDLMCERYRTRLREGRCLAVAGAFPLPKPGKDELRRMAWLNPYDDVYLRIIVGRVAGAIEAALGPDVFSYRIENEAPGWTVQASKQALKRRRGRGEALLADRRCNAIGVSDIRRYYPSIVPETVTEALCKVAAPRGAVRLIDKLLAELVTMGAPQGLPIGPEASGLLGNIVLLAVDEAIVDHVLGHVRYTDDSWLYLCSESDWAEVKEVYAASASTIGLEVNTSKVAIHTKQSGNAAHTMHHEQIAYLTSDGARDLTSQMATETIQSQLDHERPDWNLIGFCLGSLRSRQCADGLAILYEDPSILCEIPSQAGRYLSVLANNKIARRKIDRDWLVDAATGPHEGRMLAGQLQACRIASLLRLNKEQGKRLEEVAVDRDCRRHAALQAWAAKAWGSSMAHRPGQAVDHVCDHGDFTLRRAFALTIHPDSVDPSRLAGWRRKMQSVDADLAPTLARLQ